jgi:hypothetical protein
MTVKLTLASLLAAFGLLAGGLPAPAAERKAACGAARVNYAPYPGAGRGLSGLPWVAGSGGSGLVALLWYWPRSWRREHVRDARIFLHGVAPAGYSTKVLWAFLAPRVRNRGGDQFVVRGRRLDGPGTLRQTFTAIGYEGQNGAPSYASIIDVPRTGCWRLDLSTGTLRGSIVVRAVTR